MISIDAEVIIHRDSYPQGRETYDPIQGEHILLPAQIGWQISSFDHDGEDSLKALKRLGITVHGREGEFYLTSLPDGMFLSREQDGLRYLYAGGKLREDTTYASIQTNRMHPRINILRWTARTR